MHEIGILTQVIETVEQIADENHVSSVREIVIEIGELSGVLPVFMDRYFPIVTENKPLFADTKLTLLSAPGQGVCNECNAFYNIMFNEGKCPRCGSRNKTIIGGQDFILKNIIVDSKEEEAANG